jgi:hypothetical protein
LGNNRTRDDPDVSLNLGHDAVEFQLEQLTSLITMYGVAVSELKETRDPAVEELTRELMTLRAAMIGALAQVGPPKLTR